MTKDDLMKFCNPEKILLSEPWSIGKYTIATNGSVLIRVKRLDTVDKRRIGPSLKGLFLKKPNSRYPIPHLPNIGDGMIQIGRATFKHSLLRLIASLPNCEIGPTTAVNPAWIWFEGGDGLIMPCLEDEAKI